MKTVIFLLAFLGAFLFYAPVWAIPITMDFTVENFETSAPVNTVTGTIVWDAVSTADPIDSLTSVSMTIGSHAYEISEVGWETPYYTANLIGGLVNGVNTITGGTNDFWITWNTETTPIEFGYTISSSSEAWRSSDFTSFSISSAAPVPEPATLLLLGTGLVGLAAGVRREMKKA